MPDVKKYVSDLDLQYYHGRAKTLFAKQTDLDALETEVQEIISEGGEPNVIETVKVNGTALTPDAQKAVDVTVPTKTSDLTNDGVDGQGTWIFPTAVRQTYGITFSVENNNGAYNVSFDESESDYLWVDFTDGEHETEYHLATTDYVDSHGGKIDSISVNNVPQTIDANKNVNITATNISEVESTLGIKATSSWGETGVAGFANNHTASLNIDGLMPRALSDFDNDEGFQTASDVQTAISSAVASAYKYKGSVATYQDLPSSGQTAGDVWDVQADGMNYAWTGSSWDALGQYVDTSTLWGKTELIAMTTAEIDALFATA